MEFDELYDEQLIYKRTPMDFIDHLWELLSRNKIRFTFVGRKCYMLSLVLGLQKTVVASMIYPRVYSILYSAPSQIIQWYERIPMVDLITSLHFPSCLNRYSSKTQPGLGKCCAKTMPHLSLRAWSLFRF